MQTLSRVFTSSQDEQDGRHRNGGPFLEAFIMGQQVTWKGLVSEALADLPREFSLRDVTAKKKMFESAYPSNRFIEAKIRQSLQVLRDQGVLEFLGNGRYRKRRFAKRSISITIDPDLAKMYSSRSQFGRVVIETWAELELYCFRCNADDLLRLPVNTPLADFECPQCRLRFQLKATQGRFGNRLVGAAYQPLVQAIRERTVPSYVLVEYDLRFRSLVYVRAIPGKVITQERVSPRKPLAKGARRAGWVGCTINLEGLPEVRIIEPAVAVRESVLSRWKELS